ncbi:nucleotide-binding universal stress UspA family protein [Thermocatellispora tengchongensis]|uniref:Nucleotide-binding universal stress UspA family protein n=1 Tax=Thermocatellispora tengchongensis TaxID=1073253 RepID=A0A840PI61_9ACTN|nr:universal stress protein [Thermocatellispora tengchongensis]MBB5135765.1 nucleotide-binding universal stress UspA family protein [Thermocatellispora tengchongensis]
MSEHIVAATDGSRSALSAVRWAAGDAARRGVPLKIVHVSESRLVDLPLRPPPGFHRTVTEHGRQVVEEAAGVARETAPGLEVSTSVVTGRPVDELRAEAERSAQIVLGNRGLGGFAGLVAGSVSLGVAGHVSVPVVVVPQVSIAPYGRIVVGYDGTAWSEAALDYAFRQAAGRGARLQAVYAWHMPALSPYAVPYSSLVEEVFCAHCATVRQMLAPWREKYPEVQMEETAVCAHPVAALRDAGAMADLVVVGSRGLGTLGCAVLGSVSHGVLRHARRPVAVVRGPG